MLVNCAAYNTDGKKIADIPKQEISDYLARPDTFVWVAMKEPNDAELLEMQEEFNLHPLAVEDASHGHQRPKIDEYGDSVFMVLHNVECAKGDLRVGEVSLFVGPNYVLSVRRGTEQGFASVRERAEREPRLLKHGPGFVFYAIVDAVVDRYFPVVDALETELEKVEARIFEDDMSARANIQSLYELKRELMTLRHAVEPLIEAIHKLYGGRVPQVCQGTQDYFRDVYDHLLRVSQQLDGLRDMVITALSVNLSMIQLGESDVTKRLAAYGALVAVPTLIAGIYGMNFEHMPELKWIFGYPISLALMAGIDFYLFRRFRKAGWL